MGIFTLFLFLKYIVLYTEWKFKNQIPFSENLHLLKQIYPVLITTKEKLKTNLNSNMNFSTLSILSETCNSIVFLCYQCLSPLRLWVRIQLRQGVLDITSCDKVCQWLTKCRWYISPYTPVSSTNKAARHYMTEILLKVALNTIHLHQKYRRWDVNNQGQLLKFIISICYEYR